MNPFICCWILPEPESSKMTFHQTSLDGVICLSNVKDKSNLIAPKLKQVIVDVSESIGSFDSDLIQIGGTILEGTVGDKVDWSRE